MAPKQPLKRAASPSVPSATKRAAGRTARRPAAESTVDAAPDTVTAADLIDEVGSGGETHQVAGGERPRLTTQQGIPVADDQNTLRGRRARPDAARGLPLPREDLPLRPRAHPRAGRPRPRLRRPRLLRDLRVAGRRHPGRPVPAGRRADAGLRALLDRRRQQGLGRPRPRRPRLRREVLHAGGQLGPRRQQHPGLLHPGRDQVPRPRPRREAGARPRLPAGAVGARQLLGLHLADARGDAHGDVDDVGPGDPAVVPVHGGLRRPHLPARQRRGRVDVRQVPLEAEARPAVGRVERGGQDQRRRPRLPPPRPVGRHRQPATSPSGSSASSSSTTTSPTSSTSTSSTPPRSSPRSWCRSAASAGSCSTARVDNFFAETEQVAFCTQNVVPGIDFTQRPAAAGPQLLLPRHPAQAARRPELHPPPGQRAEVPGRPLPAGRPHGDASTRSGRVNYEPNSWTRRRRRPAGGPRRRLPTLRRADRRRPSSGSARSASPTTTARPASSTSARRRSSRRTSSTRSSSSCRKCEQPGDPGPDGRQPAQRRRGLRPTRSPTGSRLDPLPDAGDAGAAADHRPAAVAGAQHRRQRPGDASPAARSACSSPTAPTPPCSTALRKAAAAEGALVELIAPQIGGVVTQRRRAAAGPPEDRRRPVGALRRRRRSSPRPRAPPLLADRRRRPRTSSPTPTPTASSSPTPPTAGPLLEAAGVADRARRRLRRARQAGQRDHVHRAVSRRAPLGPLGAGRLPDGA